ncbi:hypothetical protein MZM54_00505 [[Brevibacterium] frigoritolerans]|nr:hypothetical protein [Peribacillus frigoritolerans]
MSHIEWYEASENNDGVKTLAMSEIDKELNLGRIVGYNGILKGDTVVYKGKEYTVVMVSRLGHFGLSETGKLPYTLCVRPDEVTA